MNNPKIVSLTLCRSGSQGVPDKNIRNLAGYPLFSYPILATRDVVDKMYVSTNDPIVKEYSRMIGIEVIDRPDDMCTPKSQSEEALLHFSKKVDFDILVFVQATSPMIKKKYIEAGLNLVFNGADSVFSVYREHWVPRWNNQKKPIGWDINNRPMRQDIEDVFVENGAFYITTRKSLIESGLRYSGNVEFVEMPISESFQVDTEEDFKLIESLMECNFHEN